MRAVVVYESMYGNTHAIAHAIARGLGTPEEVTVVPVSEAGPTVLEGADLLVVGGPTHVHGMSRTSTRKAAVEAARKPGTEVILDPDAEGADLRTWFSQLQDFKGAAAAFDTRLHGAGFLTGRASRRIARLLHRHGFVLIVPPESFFVTKDGHLDRGEERRASEWGRQLTSGAEAAAIAGLAGRTVSVGHNSSAS